MKKVINYTELTEQNKNEFVQFLIKSQIRGTQKQSSQAPNKNRSNIRQNKQNNSIPERKASINSIQKAIKLTPNKGYTKNHIVKKDRGSEKKSQSPNIKNSVKKHKKNVFSENQSSNNATPPRPTTSSDQVTMSLSDFQAKTQKQYKLNENRSRSITDRPPKSPLRSRISIRHKNSAEKSVKHNSEKEIKDKLPSFPPTNLHKVTEQQKSTNNTFFKCLKHMQINLGGIRPIKWPTPQLHKAVQEIFSELFSKNHILLQLNKSGQKTKGIMSWSVNSSINSLITSMYVNKFKSNKLGIFNLINLFYSLSVYVNRTIPIYYNYHLVIFQKIITEEYSVEEVLFFLYSRSTMEKVFRVSFNSLWEKSSKEYLRDELFVVDESRLVLFLKGILQGQIDLVYKYKNTIFSGNIPKSIHCYQVLSTLLKDYTQKRQQFQSQNIEKIENNNKVVKTEPSRHEADKRSLSSRDNFLQDQVQQTMSEQNSERHFQNDFWDCKQIAEIKVDDDFEIAMLRKLQSKVWNLINIVCSDNDSKEKQVVYEITYRKAVNLVHSLFQMNKYLWFKELQVQNPQASDIRMIQELQISLRKISEMYKANSNSKQLEKELSNFCKKVLTVKVFTEQLEKVVTAAGGP